MRNCPKVQRQHPHCCIFDWSLLILIGYQELLHIQYKAHAPAALILKKQSSALICLAHAAAHCIINWCTVYDDGGWSSYFNLDYQADICLASTPGKKLQIVTTLYLCTLLARDRLACLLGLGYFYGILGSLYLSHLILEIHPVYLMLLMIIP